MGLSEKDVKAIKDTHAKMMKSYMDIDMERFAELCTDDTIMVPSEGKTFHAQGKKSLHDWLVEHMSGIESLEIEYDIREINGDGNCAYVLSPNIDKVRLSGRDETFVFDNCECLSVFERQRDNSWKIKMQMNKCLKT